MLLMFFTEMKTSNDLTMAELLRFNRRKVIRSELHNSRVRESLIIFYGITESHRNARFRLMNLFLISRLYDKNSV